MNNIDGLRDKFDSNDSFFTGHQIVKVRKKEKKIPEWAKDDQKIKQILLRSFPKLASNSKQRTKAARWATIIQLYYKLDYTHGQIVNELNEQNPKKKVTLNQIKMTIRSIKWVAQGIRANGTGYLGNPRGGYRKKPAVTQPELPLEVKNEQT